MTDSGEKKPPAKRVKEKPTVEVEPTISQPSGNKTERITEFKAMMGFGKVPNPIHQKMNEEHITQVLDLALKHDRRQYNLHKRSQDHEHIHTVSNRRYVFLVFLVLVVFMLGLCCYSKIHLKYWCR